MALASTSRVQLRYSDEGAAYGVIPATPVPNTLRITGESLSFALKTEVSKEIRSDRQETDLVLTDASASGGFNFELSYNEFDDLMAAACQAAWTVFGVAGVGATFTGAVVTFTASTVTAASATSGASDLSTLARASGSR